MAKKKSTINKVNPFNNYVDITSSGPLTTKQLQSLDPSYKAPAEIAIADMSWRDPSLSRGNTFNIGTDPSDYGTSKYDWGVGTSESIDHYQNNRGEEQSWYTQLGAGVAKMATTAISTFLDGTVGTIAGLYSSITRDGIRGIYDNAFSRAMSDFDDYMERNLPNYKTDEENENPWYANLATANFWADQIKQAGFTIGAFGASYATAGIGKLIGGGLKAIGALGKGIDATARGARALQEATKLGRIAKGKNLLYNTIAGFNEGRTEARNNVNDWNETQREELNQAYDKIIDEQYENQEAQALKTFEQNRALYGDDAAFAQYQNTINKINSEKQTLKASKEQSSAYQRTLNKIQEDSSTMGAWELGLNTLLLSASNMIQFGNAFGTGFISARNLLNAREHVTASTVRKAMRATGAVIKNPLTEGLEEMNQAVIADFSGREAASITDYHKALLNPNARQKTDSMFTNALNAFTSTYGDIDNYAEFFGGAVMGAVGVPMVRWPKSKKGKWQSPVTMQGGIRESWKEYKAIKDREENLINYIDNRVKDPKYKDYYQGLVRHIKFQEDMDNAVESGDLFNFKNAEHSQLFTDVTMFDNVGELETLKKNISDYSTLNSNEDAINLVRDTTSVSEDKKSLNGPFSQYATLKADGSIEVNLSDSQIQEIKDKVEHRKEKVLNFIDQYQQNKKEIDAEIMLSLRGEVNPETRVSDEDLAELMYLRSCEQNYQSRFDDLFNQNVGNLRTIYARHNKDKEDPLYKLATATTDEEFKKEFTKLVSSNEFALYLHTLNENGEQDQSKVDQVKQFSDAYNALVGFKKDLDKGTFNPTIFQDPNKQQEVENNLTDIENINKEITHNQKSIDDNKNKIKDLRKQARRKNLSQAEKNKIQSEISDLQSKNSTLKAANKQNSRKLTAAQKKRNSYFQEAYNLFSTERARLDAEVTKAKLGRFRLNDPYFESNASAGFEATLQDLINLTTAKKQYAKRFREFLYNPGSISKGKEAANKAEEEKEEEEEVNDIKDSIINCTSVSQLRQLLKDNEDNIENIDDLLDEVQNENPNSAISNIIDEYYSINEIADQLFNIILNAGLNQDELQNAASLLEHLKSISEIKDSMLDSSSTGLLAKQKDFFRDDPNIQDPDSAFLKASNALKQAMDLYKQATSSQAPTGSAGNGTNNGNKGNTGSGSNAGNNNGTTSGTGSSTTGNSTTTGDNSSHLGEQSYNPITKEDNEELSQNESFASTQNNNNGPYNWLTNAYPQTYKVNGNYITYDEAIDKWNGGTKQQKEVGKFIYKFLDAQGAYNYVNNGNLHVGDVVTFEVNPTLEAELKKLDPSYSGPTILETVKTKEGKKQYIGVLHRNIATNNSKYVGHKELCDAITAGYNKNPNKEYIHPVSTSVNQVLRGHYIFDANDRPLSKGDQLLKGQSPKFAIVKGGNLVPISKGIDANKIRNNTYKNSEGRLYLLLDDGTGKYSAFPIRVTRLNEGVLANVNNPFNKEIDGLLNDMLNNIDNPKNKDIFNAFKKKLSKYVHLPIDLDINYINNIKEVGITFVKDNERSKVTIKYRKDVNDKDVYEISEDGELNLISTSDTRWKSNNIQNIKDALKDLIAKNCSINLSEKSFENTDFINLLLESSVLNTNVNQIGVQDNFFHLNPIINGQQTTGSTVQPSPTNFGSKGSINNVPFRDKFVTVEYDDTSNILRVGIPKTSNGYDFLYDKNAGINSLTKEEIESLRWYCRLHQIYGDTIDDGDKLLNNKYFLVDKNSGIITKVFDRSTNKFLVGKEKTKAISDYKNRHKPLNKTVEKIIQEIEENQKKVHRESGDNGSFYYYIDTDSNGNYSLFSRMHSIVTSPFLSPLEKSRDETDGNDKDITNEITALCKNIIKDPTNDLYLNRIRTLCNNKYVARKGLRQLISAKTFKDNLDNLSFDYTLPQGSKQETEEQKVARMVHTVENVFSDSNSRALKHGFEVDELCRKILKGETRLQKPSYMTEAAYKHLIAKMSEIKDLIESQGGRILTDRLVLWDENTKIAGEVDALVVFPNGKVSILDFKTSKNSFYDKNGQLSSYFEFGSSKNKNQVISSYDSYSQQLTGYQCCFKKQYGIDAKAAIIPIHLQYGSASSSVINTAIEGINIQHSINTKFRQEIANKFNSTQSSDSQNNNNHPTKPKPTAPTQTVFSVETLFNGLNEKTDILENIPFSEENLKKGKKVGTININNKTYDVYDKYIKVPTSDGQNHFFRIASIKTGKELFYYIIGDKGVAIPIEGWEDANINEIRDKMLVEQYMSQYSNGINPFNLPTDIPTDSTTTNITNKKRNRGNTTTGKPKNREVSSLNPTVFNKKEELEWLNRVLPQLSKEDRIQIVKGLINVAEKGTKAWGQFVDGMVKISDQAAKGTVYHEAFHVVFNTLLKESERNSLLKEAKNKFGTTSNLDTEERLAESFREFVENGGQDTRSFGKRISDFFKNLLLKITHWNKISPSIDYYFNRINSGKYANKTINSYKGTLNREAAEGVLNKEIFRKEAESFMSKFGISIKDVESLPNNEELFDALNRVIYVTKDSDITESMGYAIAFMMQHSQEVKEVIALKLKGTSNVTLKGIRRALKNRGEFDISVNNKFWNYLDKDELLKEIGQDIAQELRKLYNLEYKDNDRNPYLNKVLDLIKEFLSKLSPAMKTRLEVITHNIRSIANSVKLQDDSLIKGKNIKPGTSSIAERVDVGKALKENPYEDSIIKTLQKYNIALAGSASIALSGTLYRPIENPLHDIDFNAGEYNKNSLDAVMKESFPNHSHVRSIHNADSATETYIILDRPFYLETRENGITYVIDKNNNEELGYFPQRSSNLILKDGVQGKFLDFFTQKSEFGNKNISINGENYLISDSRNAFKAKIDWARNKDIWDYVRYVPNESIEQLEKQKKQEINELKAKMQGARVIWGHPAIGKTTYLQKNNDILEWDEEVNPKRNKFIRDQIDPNHTMDINSIEYKNLKQEYMKNYNNPAYREFLRREWDNLLARAKKENKRVFASPLPLLQLFPNSFDLIIATPYQDFINRNMQRGGTSLNSRGWKQAIDDVLIKQDASKVYYTNEYFSDFIRHNLGVKWGVLTSEEINILQSAGWTEEEFDALDQEEKEQALLCAGF